MDFPPLELVRVACVPACAYMKGTTISTIQKVRNDFGAEWNARRKDHAAAVLLGLRESSTFCQDSHHVKKAPQVTVEHLSNHKSI